MNTKTSTFVTLVVDEYSDGRVYQVEYLVNKNSIMRAHAWYSKRWSKWIVEVVTNDGMKFEVSHADKDAAAALLTDIAS